MVIGFWGMIPICKYLFWDGNDVFQKISRVGFFVEKRKTDWVSNVYLTCKDESDLDSFFQDLSIKLGGFHKKSSHLWKKHYESLDYIGNLTEFIDHDKTIIDEIINNGMQSPISMIDENVFKLQLNKVLAFRN